MDRILLNAGSSGENGAHSTEMAMRCLRLYSLRTMNGGFTMEKEPLVRGSIGHVALAHRYARKWAVQNGEDPEAFYTPMEAAEIEAAGHKSLGAKMLKVIKEIYPTYDARFADEDWEILDVENVLSATIAGKWTHTQRADLVVQRPSGKRYIADHKFVSFASDDTANRYILSVQFVGYAVLGRQHYENFGGVIANIIGCHNGKFIRQVMDPSPEAVKWFENTIIEARERVERWRDRDPSGASWPKALSEMACVTPYGPCEAFSLCQWGFR